MARVQLAHFAAGLLRLVRPFIRMNAEQAAAWDVVLSVLDTIAAATS
jgi:hypothetical protein